MRGLTENSEEWDLNDKIHIFSHLETARMKEYMLRSHIVICRPGYSSLMDPGDAGNQGYPDPDTRGVQTEQEITSGQEPDGKKDLLFNAPVPL